MSASAGPGGRGLPAGPRGRGSRRIPDAWSRADLSTLAVRVDPLAGNPLMKISLQVTLTDGRVARTSRQLDPQRAHHVAMLVAGYHARVADTDRHRAVVCALTDAGVGPPDRWWIWGDGR